MQFLRDMLVRLRVQDEGVVPAVERANQALDEFAGSVRTAAKETVTLQNATADTTTVLGGLRSRLSAIWADFRQYQAVLGGIGMAGVGLMTYAAKQAEAAEWAFVRARQLLGENFNAVYQALLRERARWRGAINISDWLEMMIPIFVSLGDQADLVAKALANITDRIMLMGGDVAAASKVWLYIAQAITSGSAEILTRASRFLPYAIVQGEEAERIARRMKREYDDVTNAMILFEAIAKSTRIEQEKLNEVMDTARFQSVRLGRAWQELAEEIGAGWSRAAGKVKGVVADIFSWILGAGGGKPFGDWFAIFSSLLAGVGGAKLIAAILAKLGIIGGASIGALLTGVLPWVLGFAAVALVIQDLLSTHSVIKKVPDMLWDLLGQFGDAVKEWVTSIFKGKQVTDEMIQRMMETNETLRIYSEFLEKKVGVEAAEFAKGARSEEEVMYRVGEEAAKWLYYEIEAAGGIKPYVSPTIAKEPWYAIVESILGPNWESLMQQYAHGQRTMQDILREAITVFESGQYERTMYAFQTLAYWKGTGYLDDVKRKLGMLPEANVAEEIAALAKEVKESGGALGGFTKVAVIPGTGQQVEVNVSFENGAVQVQLGGDYSRVLAPEVSERIIQETLRAIEAQLRAALAEEPHPGVR